MSIEAKIESLTQAVERLCAALEKSNVPPAAAPAVPTVAVTPIVPVTVTPTPEVAAPVAPVLASPSNMPAPPVFVAPAPAAPAGVPFTDGKGLVAYVMESYRNLGAAKGAQIQGVLTTLGYKNINEVKPEHYSALFAGVEALK